MFTDRDLTQTADTSKATYYTVSDGKTIEITEAGIYVISGSAKNCTIKVNAGDSDKVQIVLDGVTITNTSTPAIYVVSADKTFVTTAKGSTNSLSVTGTFTADGTTNTDAVIFSKDDLTLNGLGTLSITSTNGNGITSKDDLKVTGGTYSITSKFDALEANDSIRISDGTFTINTDKDALHSENDDDNTKGYVYICGGTFDIDAGSDGIRATTTAQIDGGTFTISAPEGIEATYVQINGGDINISSNDDGINASQKSTSETVTFEMTGGKLTITMASGDTDAIDSNGNVIVSGGTINITCPTQGTAESFDYDGTATYTGGTIIVNGETLSEIPTPMMMGGMGGNSGRMGGGFGGNGRFNRT
ncbi:MAG: carbohydrate-binding domain-containing protein [Ruminococcus sp.]|nr:carbohydrate-binding domain-containing protein [Ruminococcus sp.]MBR1751134.1 carbohydrate-binding domain-containing protein [Ruminococcus sp.]